VTASIRGPPAAYCNQVTQTLSRVSRVARTGYGDPTQPASALFVGRVSIGQSTLALREALWPGVIFLWCSDDKILSVASFRRGIERREAGRTGQGLQRAQRWLHELAAGELRDCIGWHPATEPERGWRCANAAFSRNGRYERYRVIPNKRAINGC
jgi:hypothetical protein